jgi:N6-L-threonylcarbamoyladenine synthase
MKSTNSSLIILGIESSCDETSASIICDGKILSNVIAGQAVHEQYGGVIPELASRAHQQNIVPVIDAAINNAKISKNDIKAVAFTQGPGLLGPLLVGSSFAKSFSLAMNIPLIAVNHMEAHILAHFIDEPKPKFPFICLTVSGGHTQIVLLHDYFRMEVIGRTTDDAAGEAFDKAAKILGIPYPGGPLIDKYASTGNAKRFPFTEPKVDGFDFSFSGLKTQILYFIQREKAKNPNFIQENMADICASIQSRIVDILLNKLQSAAKEYNITEIAIAGGVSANSCLRSELNFRAEQNAWNTYVPQLAYCTDNAAMIAMVGHLKYLQSDFVKQDVVPMARQAIGSK